MRLFSILRLNYNEIVTKSGTGKWSLFCFTKLYYEWQKSFWEIGMTVPKFSLWNDDKFNIQEQTALLFFGDEHNVEPRLIIKLYHIKIEAFTSHSLISLPPAYSLDGRHYLTAKKNIS